MHKLECTYAPVLTAHNPILAVLDKCVDKHQGQMVPAKELY